MSPPGPTPPFGAEWGPSVWRVSGGGGSYDGRTGRLTSIGAPEDRLVGLVKTEIVKSSSQVNTPPRPKSVETLLTSRLLGVLKFQDTVHCCPS